MPPNESPSVTVSRRRPGHLRSDPVRTVVWVRGDHDIATRMHLSVTLAKAARFDDADILVDLSGVTFMDASTIGALVVARNHLLVRSRSLAVRTPSPPARRLLDLCGLVQLIDEYLPSAQRPLGTALGSWVDVPVRDRLPEPAPSAVAPEAPSQEPASATVGQRVEPARSIEQRRAPP